MVARPHVSKSGCPPCGRMAYFDLASEIKSWLLPRGERQCGACARTSHHQAH